MKVSDFPWVISRASKQSGTIKCLGKGQARSNSVIKLPGHRVRGGGVSGMRMAGNSYGKATRLHVMGPESKGTSVK